LTPDELKAARRRLALSVEAFADMFCVNSRTLRGWEAGSRGGEPVSVPAPVALLVRLALEVPAARAWLRGIRPF
jgi:hypothetical protein